MNRLSLLSLLFLLGLVACHEHGPVKPYTTSADFKKAQNLYYRNGDSAFYYFNKVIAESKDSLQIAMSYNNMAMIQSGAGDYFGAQESLLTSLKFLDPGKERHINCLTSDYNELGLNSADLKNYNAAIEFYNAAEKVVDDSAFRLVIANNKALAYQKKGAYAQALKLYRQTLSRSPKGSVEYARILSNTAKTRWLQDPYYKAAPEMLQALHIRQKEKDLWGQNASYAHLSDYYARSQPDTALRYASQMYQVAHRLNSPDDQLEALQKLIRLGPVNIQKPYFERYRLLDDSLQTARAAARNQFALVRYDAEKNKSANLKLQKDNTEKDYRILLQYIVIAMILLLLAAAIFWYRNALRASKLRTSKKVHDVVANGLYRVISALDNQERVEREQLLDQLELLYEQSRDISYDHIKTQETSFPEEIAGIITTFSSLETRVSVTGCTEEFWDTTSNMVRYELKQVLQELMVNMRKHSHARNVLVKFEKQSGGHRIVYTDDGVGISEKAVFHNGLKNTGNRIKAIRGDIIFDSKTGKGLSVSITFPK